MKNRSRLRWVVVIAVVLAVVGSLVGYYKWRESERLDMKRDVVASGFKLADTNWENPRIEDETKTVKHGKKSRTESHTYIETTVVVGKCWVELEREIGILTNNAKVRTSAGRAIESYELDEIVNFRGNEEHEIDGAPSAPTPQQVIDYLKADAATQYCLAA